MERYLRRPLAVKVLIIWNLLTQANRPRLLCSANCTSYCPGEYRRGVPTTPLTQRIGGIREYRRELLQWKMSQVLMEQVPVVPRGYCTFHKCA